MKLQRISRVLQKRENMKSLKVYKSVFGLKLAALGCFFCSAVWLCMFALFILPGRIASSGAEGPGAIVGIFGVGVAIAVVIAITMLITAGVLVLLLCTAIFVVKERKYSPYNESEEKNRKKYIGFRIAGDVIYAVSAIVLVWLAVSFGIQGLPSSLTAGLGILAALAAEILTIVFHEKQDPEIKKE